MRDTPEERTVAFKCHPDNEENAIPPAAVFAKHPELARDNWIPEAFAEASERDVQITDATQYGWYLYTPEPVMFTRDENGSYTPRTGSDVLEPAEEVQLLDGGYTAYLDTLWHANIPDGYTLLILSPYHSNDSIVRGTSYTSDETWPRVKIPLAVNTRTTIHPAEPIAVAILTPTHMVQPGTSTATIYTDDAKQRYNRATAFTELSANPYEDGVHSPKNLPGDSE